MASYKGGSGVRISRPSKQSLEELMKALSIVTDVEVLVGFPEDTTTREATADEPANITNAALGYIHDQGAPEANIPQREFMAPGIESARDDLTNKLGQILKASIRKGSSATIVEIGMQQVGIIAALAIKNKINEGIEPPLADSTLIARARRGRKGAATELMLRRKKLAAPSTVLAKPLIDTGQLRNAITYAIRSRKKRSK